MPIVRKKLIPSEVYPDDLRYNADTDTVQTNINGDWVDSPQADPRHQTTFPPRLTSNPSCDAAESVKDAFKGQIDGILTAIDNGGTAFTIAGSILGLLSFGPFGIFISIALTIANAMLDAGTTALSDALTETVYHQFVCVLACNMDGSGRLDEDSLAQCETEITDQIGGLAAIILNSMLALAGEGGVNNLAALGTSTGDCSDCECSWCYEFDFEVTDGGFTLYPGTDGNYIPGTGWQSVWWVGGDSNSYTAVDLQKTFSGTITHVELDVDLSVLSGFPYPNHWSFVQTNIGFTADSGGAPGATGLYSYSWDGSQTVTGINQLWSGAGFRGGNNDPGGVTTIKRLLLRGTGDNPFGADNC